MSISRFVAAACAVFSVVALALVGAPAAQAEPYRPGIAVFLADGVTPVGDTKLHAGDQLVVKGRGFNPLDNTSGLPLPVPPGVPHGTFITFGAFAPTWQPSKGAPESARATVRTQTQWALSRDALSRVPNVPFDLRRTIRQQWVELDAAGRFTARITLATPTSIPRDAKWGVYTYGGAGAVNRAQELAVPVTYSTDAGPNTPKPATENLVWNYSAALTSAIKSSDGALVGKDGATAAKDGRLSFELTSNTVTNDRGELRYRGTVLAYTKFHLLEIAMADPIIRVRGNRAVISMRTSTTDMNGTDALRRTDVADITLTPAQQAQLRRTATVSGIQATFRPGITPTSLGAVSLGASGPITLAF